MQWGESKTDRWQADAGDSCDPAGAAREFLAAHRLAELPEAALHDKSALL